MSDIRNNGRLSAFVKPVDRLRLYSVIASCAANGLSFVDKLEELATLYAERDDDQLITAVLENVRRRLEGGDGIGAAVLSACSGVYPEEVVLLRAADEVADQVKSARLFLDAIQFINLEERIAASSKTTRHA